MIKKTHIWQEYTADTDGRIVVGATFEDWQGEKKELWYKVNSRHKEQITQSCDPFVVGLIFTGMRQGTNLVVHGEVSPSLLRNLEEFQAAWRCWRPEQYHKIEIIAEKEVEQEKNRENNKSIMAFSGGVDSCFTAWRHHRGCGRLTHNLRTGIMVYGFDIPLGKNDIFEMAAEKSRKMLESIGMELITIETNFRQLDDNWEDAHGAGLASCMTLLSGGFSSGLIGSSDPYQKLNLPWGSNAVSDWMMSSDNFSIINDGAGFDRNQKVRNIANWPEAKKYLRVCWEGEQKDRNCGRCEKCIRTILNFRAMGIRLPECFENDVTDEQILGMRPLHFSEVIEYKPILEAAKAAHINESWVQALDKCIKKNQDSKSIVRRMAKAIGFRRHIRKMRIK